MPVQIVSSTSLSYVKNDNNVDVTTKVRYEKSEQLNTNTSLTYGIGLTKVNVINSISYKQLSSLDLRNIVKWSGTLVEVDTVNKVDKWGIIPYKDVSFNIGKLILTTPKDHISTLKYFNVLPYKDIISKFKFRSVNKYLNKTFVDFNNNYLPASDFNFTGEIAGFHGVFTSPDDLDSIKSDLSPVDQVSNYPWSKSKIKDIIKDITWGYGINKFLIGGVTNNNYLIDPDALTGEYPDTPDTERVVRFVNIINIVTLPARIPVNFSDFSLGIDVDSMAYSFSITVPNKATADLIKPAQLSVVELEININGELFLVFVNKTRTTKNVDKQGKVSKKVLCQGFSVHKLLTYPYSPRVSFTETTASTPAGILNNELIGSGFTGTWSCPSWTIPANTYSYVNKSKMAGIIDLVKAVGGVVIPDASAKSFTIKPRYPASPWHWSSTTPDEALNEANFFSMDTEWIPQESPDSIYIFGDDNNGIGVKCTINGTAGVKTLPSITNKYMTDTIPATERGRIEVAKNGFLEIIPVSTFVDPNTGVLKPLTLVEVTEEDGITTWKALVISVSLNMKRNGNALVQTLQLERFYDVI